MVFDADRLLRVVYEIDITQSRLQRSSRPGTQPTIDEWFAGGGEKKWKNAQKNNLKNEQPQRKIPKIAMHSASMLFHP